MKDFLYAAGNLMAVLALVFGVGLAIFLICNAWWLTGLRGDALFFADMASVTLALAAGSFVALRLAKAR